VTTPHHATLIAVIHDEDLFRIRHRLRKIIEKKGPNPDVEFWIDVLTVELEAREAEHNARVETIRKTG
jgi:hypothetical protein